MMLVSGWGLRDPNANPFLLTDELSSFEFELG